MSNYQRIDEVKEEDEKVYNEPSYRVPQFESFQLGKDKEIQPVVQSFRRWCYILIALAIPMPLAAWFTEQDHIIFYQSFAFFISQILLGLAGLRTTKQNVFRRLESYQKFIHLYFLLLILALIINQIFLTYTVIKHNEDNCQDFTFNKVCDGRWGIMSAQLMLILFYPNIDMFVFLIYRYFLFKVTKLKEVLLLREV